MKIGDVEISYEQPPVFVAEISCNHMGQLHNAISLIHRAKECGAHFVKFQCYEPDALTLPGRFILPDGPWAGRDLYALYEEAQTPYTWFNFLAEYCRRIEMPWFSSVFNMYGLEVLEAASCPAYKIASCEITDVALIRNVAHTGKPMIISTGMASAEDIDRAVKTVRDVHEAPILLHCIAGYPSKIHEAQLRAIAALYSRFDCDVGLSDHSKGYAVPVAATTLGVVMIEKHLQIATPKPPLDADHSLWPSQFKEMVEACTHIWWAMHHHNLRMDTCVTGSELPTYWARRSLRAIRDIEPGEGFTRHNVGAIRPSGGLPPWRLDEVLRCTATGSIPAGDALNESDLCRVPNL